MFLQLKHTTLDIYTAASDLVVECYKMTRLLPLDERYNLVSQIRRASLSVKLNIAEGASRKSVLERKRFYEIARGSVVELDAAFEICFKLDYYSFESLQKTSTLINRCYSMLSKMAE